MSPKSLVRWWHYIPLVGFVDITIRDAVGSENWRAYRPNPRKFFADKWVWYHTLTTSTALTGADMILKYSKT